MDNKELLPEELLGIDDFANDFTDEVSDEENSELEGLALRFRTPWTRNHSRVAKMYRRKSYARIYRKAAIRSSMTRNQKLLFAKVNKLDSETVKRIQKGSVKSRDLSFYIRKEITGASGIIKLFDDTIDRVEGITNISKGKLAEHVNLLMSRMEMNYGEGDKVLTADFGTIASSDKPGLINGEVEVLIGGASVLKYPVSDFVNPDRKYFGNGPDNGVNFESPILIPEKTDIQVNLVLVDAVKPNGSEKLFVEVKFKGNGVAPVK